MQQPFYLALTQLGEGIRSLLKSTWSIHSLVQVRDHSMDDSPPNITSVISTSSKAYQFQCQGRRGFVLFSSEWASWLMSELLGMPLANDASAMAEFMAYHVIDRVFKPTPIFDGCHEVAVQGIWVHPLFDHFYPMSISVYRTPTQPINIWVYFPRESAHD